MKCDQIGILETYKSLGAYPDKFRRIESFVRVELILSIYIKSKLPINRFLQVDSCFLWEEAVCLQFHLISLRQSYRKLCALEGSICAIFVSSLLMVSMIALFINNTLSEIPINASFILLLSFVIN